MRTKISLTSFLLVGAVSGYAYDAKDKYTPCLDYYTVGESQCRPQASTPLQPVSPPATMPSSQTAVIAPVSSPQQPQTMEQKVDQYLENYGKPPREFVEFYLNPTPENARKWAVTYNNMVKKGKDISDIWSRTDALYQQGGGQVPALPLASAAVEGDQSATNVKTAASPEIRIGGLSSAEVGKGPENAVQERVHITYYFSKTCPFCAKMTPQLFNIFNSSPDKLAFTCVDVTPISAAYRPEPANIEGQLPCQWRLPNEGEVDQQAIRQTPTLLISQKQGVPLRLSGYVPLEQLRQYIFPEKAVEPF